MNISQHLALLTCGATLLLDTGCVGYRLGKTLEGIETVAVPTFVNKTREPMIEAETTQATIREIQNEGSLQVAGETEADAVLKVTIRDFILSPVAYKRNDATTAREYRLTIKVAYELKPKSGANPITGMAAGEAVFPVTGDLSSSKLTVLPEAADDLAHNIVEKIVEAWP